MIDLVARGSRIVGTNQGDANPRVVIPQLIELYRLGRLPIERIVFFFYFWAINELYSVSVVGSVIFL